jgi:hypothetical protein
MKMKLMNSKRADYSTKWLLRRVEWRKPKISKFSKSEKSNKARRRVTRPSRLKGELRWMELLEPRQRLRLRPPQRAKSELVSSFIK